MACARMVGDSTPNNFVLANIDEICGGNNCMFIAFREAVHRGEQGNPGRKIR
jgi:hypothetical protein